MERGAPFLILQTTGPALEGSSFYSTFTRREYHRDIDSPQETKGVSFASAMPGWETGVDA